jgi:hypothetical protein
MSRELRSDDRVKHLYSVLGLLSLLSTQGPANVTLKSVIEQKAALIGVRIAP